MTFVVAVVLALGGCGGSSSGGKHASSGSNTAPGTGAGGASGSQGSGTGHAGGRPNGVASQPPRDVVALAVRAIDQVASVHLAGGMQDGGIPVRLDLHLVRSEGGEGQISENGLDFRMIAIGRVLYIQGSDAFWTHFGGATAAKLFHDRWLKAPNSGQFASLGALTSIPRLFAQLLTKHGALRLGRRTTVNGQPAVGVVDKTGGDTLFVATTGKPYPLQIVKRGTGGGNVVFDQFNQPVKLTAPAGAIKFPGVG